MGGQSSSGRARRRAGWPRRGGSRAPRTVQRIIRASGLHPTHPRRSPAQGACACPCDPITQNETHKKRDFDSTSSVEQPATRHVQKTVCSLTMLRNPRVFQPRLSSVARHSPRAGARPPRPCTASCSDFCSRRWSSSRGRATTASPARTPRRISWAATPSATSSTWARRSIPPTWRRGR